jgi:antibiotic biosynthesis monooxygenase (ABM) superfamily enzyme
MTTAPAAVEGFVSSEVNAPSHGELAWSVVHNFRHADALKAWRASAAYHGLLREAQTLVDAADAQALREDEVAEGLGGGVVTEIVTTYVKPGKDREYQAWAEKVRRAEALFPGYRGGYLQPPVSEQQHYWTTLVRFAAPEQLDSWLSSDVRHELLHEHEGLVQSWEHHRLPGSFPGWFPSDPASGKSPPSWKQSMLVVLMLFPIVVLELRYLSPSMRGLNAAAATFIGNVISVSLLAWPLMPLTISIMRWWLLPRKDRARWATPVGVAFLIVLYAVEITFLSRLL